MQWLLRSIFILSLCCGGNAYAASFDCTKAVTRSEQTICAHRVLNDADVKMSQTYSILRRLVPMGSRSLIQNDQVKWLVFRDQCLESVSCLQEVYNMRQQQLDLYLERLYRKGPYSF